MVKLVGLCTIYLHISYTKNSFITRDNCSSFIYLFMHYLIPTLVFTVVGMLFWNSLFVRFVPNYKEDKSIIDTRDLTIAGFSYFILNLFVSYLLYN